MISTVNYCPRLYNVKTAVERSTRKRNTEIRKSLNINDKNYKRSRIATIKREKVDYCIPAPNRVAEHVLCIINCLLDTDAVRNLIANSVLPALWLSVVGIKSTLSLCLLMSDPFIILEQVDIFIQSSKVTLRPHLM